MRFTNFLLVAAAAVLASCEAVSMVTDSTQTKLSTMTSPDAVQSTDVVHDGKRFLRTTKTEKYEVDNDEDDDDDDDDDDERNSVDDEERGNSVSQKWLNQFSKWHRRNEKADDVYARYALEPVVRKAYKYGQIDDLLKRKDYKKYLAYSAWLKKHGWSLLTNKIIAP
ncbi:hypothetical protein G195_005557 [Phytophthora kernoviae 00238/432]|uniref:RxLR effector protein n=1 Tax=Phytophthora kernoviae 00238/432 TaxID=1284355 RepID=A0A8J4S4U3_9STRA|nr:hypothetical protein G195_005557 [Phytophthora kernoviae 00238/432]